MKKNLKTVNHTVIEKKDNKEIYDMVDELVATHHSHLAEASFVLVYRRGWKEDKDGHIVLGKVRKAGDIDRDLHGYNFIFLLNEESWQEMLHDHKVVVLDRLLSKCGVTEEDGEYKRDENGNVCYRLRSYDIEDFLKVAERHGMHSREVEEYVKAALGKKQEVVNEQSER